MRLEHYNEDKLKKEILSVLAKHLDLKKYKVFFFGSRVSGGGSDRSDIDVGIEGGAPVPDRVWAEIKEEIENLPLLHKIEIVDFKRVSRVFRQVAEQDVELIFP